MISASMRRPEPSSSSSMSLVQIIACNNKAIFNLPKPGLRDAASSPSKGSIWWERILPVDAAAASRPTDFGKRLRARGLLSRFPRHETHLYPARAPPSSCRVSPCALHVRIGVRHLASSDLLICTTCTQGPADPFYFILPLLITNIAQSVHSRASASSDP